MATTDITERFSRNQYDAVVIGSGPNGLAAAITLLQKGLSVAVIEAQSTAGGGCRSAQLTLPGYVHDICSSVHPLAVGSPFFRTLPLEKHGLTWVHPTAAYAHPFDSGQAVSVERSIDETAEQMGEDSEAYRRLMYRLHPNVEMVCQSLLKPPMMAAHPLVLAQFGLYAIQSVRSLCQLVFRGETAKATMAGVCAHSSLTMDAPASAAFGLVLGSAAHAVGWPMPKGGAQKLTDALVSYMQSLGGELILAAPVTSLTQLPKTRFVFLDITPRQLLKIGGDLVPPSYRKQIETYKYGPGSYKMDWALDGPVPWTAKECTRTATVHLGGTLDEIAVSEQAVWNGAPGDRPYVLLVQASLFDDTRAPLGKHTLWAYCHVPNGSRENMSERIESQIERYAPGFKKLILARSVLTPADLEQKNANYIGGDINGGALSLSQLFTRPFFRLIPYKTVLKGVYFCSSSSPPGGGVHGMCGYYAANAALLGR